MSLSSSSQGSILVEFPLFSAQCSMWLELSLDHDKIDFMIESDPSHSGQIYLVWLVTLQLYERKEKMAWLEGDA